MWSKKNRPVLLRGPSQSSPSCSPPAATPLPACHAVAARRRLTRLVGGQALGKLRFIEGDRPGSNLTYVEAPDLATLACLQNRLNELGENFAIEIRGW